MRASVIAATPSILLLLLLLYYFRVILELEPGAAEQPDARYGVASINTCAAPKIRNKYSQKLNWSGSCTKKNFPIEKCHENRHNFDYGEEKQKKHLVTPGLTSQQGPVEIIVNK